MAITVLPDVLKSTVDYLKTVPEVTAIVATSAGWTGGGSGPRISGVLGADWRVPTQAVVIRRAGGPGQLGAGRHASRLDVWCYGANAREAVNLWRVVHPALCPEPPNLIGWTQAGCRVIDVQQNADAIPSDDLEVGWSVLVTPYVLTYYTAARP